MQAISWASAPLAPGNDITYLLPIKSASLYGLEELTAYLHTLNAELVIVDGSEPSIFKEHAARWSTIARHVAPSVDIRGLNGKVRGVLTGLTYASNEKIIIADDDVRYSTAGLRAMSDALNAADVVRPQNFFEPHTWHTLLDTGRTLINRISGGDWPGTLGIRRAALSSGYNANVLFENLELVRTIRARGGHEQIADDIYVARRPPSSGHFFSQRVRQAYDEFARPGRFAVSLCILPLFFVMRRHPRWVACACGAAILAAEAGRRRSGGRQHFPVLSSLIAPLWVLERSVCVWLALIMRLRYGGIPYGDSVLRDAATPSAKLRSGASR